MKKNFFTLAVICCFFSGVFIAFSIFYSLRTFNVSPFPINTGNLNFKDLIKLRAYVVQSGSMEPSIKTGGAVFTYPVNSYVQGDIITFKPDEKSKTLVTHRVALKKYPNGVNSDPVYLTTGDANEEIDNWEISPSQIVGKVFITMPYVGYAVDFAKRPQGYIFLIVVPITIIIYEEMKVIFSEFRKGTKKIKSKINKSDTETVNIISTENNTKLSRKAIIFPIFGAIFLTIAFTSSYYSDIEESIGNIFRAGTWIAPSNTTISIPTPTPTPSPTPTNNPTFQSPSPSIEPI